MNAPSDEQLVAYLDDELDREQRSQLDSLIADDPLLSLRPNLHGNCVQTSVLRSECIQGSKASGSPNGRPCAGAS